MPEPKRLDDDPGMNMTPMIDIVFQLIVFFLLTLRFHDVDRRLDANLPPQGLEPGPPVDDVRPVRASLFRDVLGGPDGRGATRVRIGGGETIVLAGTEAERTRALERIHREVLDLRDRTGGTKAEIRAPLPTGPLVPHGDVVAVLDQMIRADLTEVGFQGLPSPGRD